MTKYSGITTLEILEEAVNYNKWIADEVGSYISPPALEIGAGTGNLSAFLINRRPLYLTDSDGGLVRHLKKRFPNSKGLKIGLLDITKAPPQNLTSHFATIFGINVLEHIKHDEKALENIFTLLKPKGKIVLLVPAKMFAYSNLDRELGHFRRYEKDELIRKLESAGFRIEKIYFFNFVGLISWYIRSKMKRKGLKPYHISLFNKIVPPLRWFESKVTIPVGISLIAIARKG